MVTEELKKYITVQVHNGEALDSIKQQLSDHGWAQKDIAEALKEVQNENPVPIPSHSSTTPQFKAPRFNLFSWEFYTANLLGYRRDNPILWALLISLMLSIAPSLFMIQKVFPFVSRLEQQATTIVEEVVPDNLEVTIKDGVASTNVTEPFYLTIRKDRLDNLFAEPEKINPAISKIRLLSIDTKGSAENFERYQSLALLTEKNLVYYDDGKVNIHSLDSVGNMHLTRKGILDTIHKMNDKNRIIRLLQIVVLAAPFIIIVMTTVSQLLFFLFITILIYFCMVKTYKIPATFGSTYRYVVLLAIIPIVVLNLCMLIPENIIITSPLAAVESMLIISLCYLGLYKVRKSMM